MIYTEQLLTINFDGIFGVCFIKFNKFVAFCSVFVKRNLAQKYSIIKSKSCFDAYLNALHGPIIIRNCSSHKSMIFETSQRNSDKFQTIHFEYTSIEHFYEINSNSFFIWNKFVSENHLFSALNLAN